MTKPKNLQKLTGEKEMKNQCSNRILQFVNELERVGVNGNKDTRYNDLIQFEKLFERYYKSVICLFRFDYGRDDKGKYVYIIPVGIYDHVGEFARKLRKIIFQEKGSITNIILLGEQLHIDTYRGNKKISGYIAVLLGINNEEDPLEGFKFNIYD